MTEGVIYLVHPMFGRDRLSRRAVVGTTWVEYTFPGDYSPASLPDDLPMDGEAPEGCHLLIPLSNIRAIATRDEAEERSANGRQSQVSRR